MDRKSIIAKVKNKLGIHLDKGRLSKARGILISEKEAKRLSDTLENFSVPSMGSSGPIRYGDKEVGKASDFLGIFLEDKDFIQKYVKDIVWYVI